MNPARLAGLLLLAVLAGAAALAGALVHAVWFPGGLLLALAGTAAVCVGGSLLFGTRGGAAVPAVAWALTVLLLIMWSRPEGDLLFGAAVSTYAYLYVGMIIGVVCATVRPPGPPRFRRPADPGGSPQ
ncbi:hypothetical protein JJV70_12615 [Streptomyces sp. JJ66]|uniref:DUF6113 family protein n=1 Tax=Streptomyces sp. JJ66 TaxID=2803843 RepID=UPI001C57EEB1|nr:DUF6113 family protein [Streptomyces sp. JJ66]MBW1602933.1 hypothetical protein [Streptomyces sp. JJ66]